MVRVRVPGNRTHEQFNQLNYSSHRERHSIQKDKSKTGTNHPPTDKFGFVSPSIMEKGENDMVDISSDRQCRN